MDGRRGGNLQDEKPKLREILKGGRKDWDERGLDGGLKALIKKRRAGELVDLCLKNHPGRTLEETEGNQLSPDGASPLIENERRLEAERFHGPGCYKKKEIWFEKARGQRSSQTQQLDMKEGERDSRPPSEKPIIGEGKNEEKRDLIAAGTRTRFL